MNRLSIALFCAVAATAPGFARAEPVAHAGDAAPAHVLTKPPRLKHFVEAELPEGAVVREPASVQLLLSITAEGRVSAAEVVESGGDVYDEPARQAALKLEFEPAEIDGAPAPVRIKYRYEFKPKQPEPRVAKTAEFSGIVRDQHTKQPLAGVRIELDNGQSALTGDDGRFLFSTVDPGTHSVTLSAPTLTPIGTEEELEAGKRYDAVYDVEVTAVAVSPEERADFEIVVVATKLGSKISATQVTADQGARVAGTGGDVVKVVENLPGVARSTVGSGQLVVWGASGQDTRVYVDGVHIPVLYHEGGFRSVVHSDLVQSVELQPGGYGASYGRGLGGLVTVGLKPLDQKGFGGSVQLDAIDASAAVHGALNDKWHFAAAARRSHLDWVLRQVTSEDVGAFVPIPKYWDGQARLAYAPKEGESLEIGTLLASDSIDHNLTEADPTQNKQESKTTSFSRGYFRYRSEGENATTNITPYFGFDNSRLVTHFGAVPAELSVKSRVFGLRATYQTNAAAWLSFTLGLDAEVVVSDLSRSGSVTTPPREGDLVIFGQRPADQVNADTWSTTIAGLAPFIESDISLFGDSLHLIPGLRVEPQVVRVSQIVPAQPDVPPTGAIREDTEVDPRLALRWNVNDRISAKAALGIYHQPPQPEDLSAVFGNPKFGPPVARQLLIGGMFRLSKPLSFELTSFYSSSDDLAVRSPLSTPLRSAALVQSGKGRAYGTQFLLRHDLIGRFFGWLSFSMIRSERTDPDGSWRLFDFDQTFVFTALGSYDLGRGFEVGSRFRYSTGYPRTPVASVTYDARADSFEPVFGPHNSIRIPPFYALDARFAKHFKFGNERELELYLDVQNVTNHKNAEEIVYNFDYSKRSYITGLPILPVLGGKLTW